MIFAKAEVNAFYLHVTLAVTNSDFEIFSNDHKLGILLAEFYFEISREVSKVQTIICKNIDGISSKSRQTLLHSTHLFSKYFF